MVSATYAADRQPAVVIRRITRADLGRALARGIDDFREKRGDVLVVGLIYPLVGIVVAAAALRSALVPLIYPLVAGLSLLGPLVAAGFYELARRREAGLEAGWSHFFSVYSGRTLGGILIVGVALGALFLIWLTVAWLLYSNAFGHDTQPSVAAFVRELFTTAAGWRVILIGNLIGLLFGIIVLAISVVSLPLIVDRPGFDPINAMSISVQAVRKNFGVMLVWGAIVLALIALGSLPLFIGLAVVLPVLGYATWHLYRQMIELG